MNCRWIRAGVRHDKAGVSEVVGAVLLLGITVGMTGALAALILNFQGPVELPRANVSLTLDPGASGWNNDDEAIRITHLGGDPLERSSTRLTYLVNGQPTTIPGSAMGGGFSDGRLTIGETSLIPQKLNSTDAVTVNLVSGPSAQVVVSSIALRPQQLGSGPGCTLDVYAPTVPTWGQTPSDVVSSTSPSTGLTITATAQDDCYGVNSTVTPTLWYCVATSCPTPGSFTQGSALTLIGTNQWQGTIPAHTWYQKAGQLLTYELRGLTDKSGRSGTATAPVDVINIVSPTYLNALTPTIGVLDAGTLANAQSATDGNAAISYREALSSVTSTLVGTSTSGSNSIGDGGGGCNSGAACAYTSNDVDAQMNHQNDVLRISGFPAVPSGATILSVIIGFEGARADSNHPQVSLTYEGVSGTPGATTFTLTSTTDASFERNVTAERNWLPGDFANLAVRVNGVDLSNSRRADIDQVYVRVQYQPVYRMELEMAWSQLPGSTTGTSPTQTLQLHYRISSGADVFNVQIWQGGSTWRTCAGQLTATTFTTFSCAFALPTEYQGGSPKVRIVDANPSGTTQTTLFIDYARVVTAS